MLIVTIWGRDIYMHHLFYGSSALSALTTLAAKLYGRDIPPVVVATTLATAGFTAGLARWDHINVRRGLTELDDTFNVDSRAVRD